MDVLRKLSDERSDDSGPPSRSTFEDLRAILTADLYAQHLKASRITVLHVLAIAGGLCWVLMMWPAALPPFLRLLALLAWPTGLLAALFFAVLEWKWDIRLSRLTKK